ncbi:MAG: serine/threonine-protein kinase [Acidobacteriota bacterium]
MTPERWQQIKQILQGALERQPEEQTAFLDEACAGDASLRTELASLIAFNQQLGDFLESPALAMDQPIFSEDEATDLQSLIGKVLDGQYQIDALLGKGGMGAVYRAHHALLEHPVALKVMLPYISNNPKYKRLFFREGRAAKLFSHPNVVTVYDLRETEDGTVYLVLEYIEGRTLSEELRKRKNLSPAESLRILSPIASALDAAHQNGVIHRDLKPGNIMIGKAADGRFTIKLLDLGIAKISRRPGEIGSTPSGTSLEQTLGTPHYMSPEQWQGCKDIDGRTDIYSLGIIFYELIAGKKPFDGETYGVLAYQHLAVTPPLLHEEVPTLPLAFSRAITRAMAKNPAERQPTATALIAELQDALRENPVPVRHRRAKRLAVATTAVLLTTAGLVRFKSQSDNHVPLSIPTPINKSISTQPTQLAQTVENNAWKPAANAFSDASLPDGSWKGAGKAKAILINEGNYQLICNADFNIRFTVDKAGNVQGEIDINYRPQLKPESAGTINYTNYESNRRFPIVGLITNSSLMLAIDIAENQLPPLELTLQFAPNVIGESALIKKINERLFSPFMGAANLQQHASAPYTASYQYTSDTLEVEWRAQQLNKRTKK